MFSRCLACSSPFPPNDALEHFPLGRRVAYDPGRGRLWAVCGACRRWSLAPIEERWEALEELERLSRDRARVLARTDRIALLQAGRLEIVRVGGADRAEEAWWRYGRELLRRRDRYRRLTVAGSAVTGALVLGGVAAGVSVWAIWWGARRLPRRIPSFARWIRFGSAAWRGRALCPRCGAPLREVPFSERRSLVLAPAPDGGLQLRHRCLRCRHPGGLRLDGIEAEQTLARVLAYHHFAGASEARVREAARLVAGTGSPERLKDALTRERPRLGSLDRTRAIALEIAAHEARERELLELELAELEARWRAEEELAAIVDGELTPVPFLETLRRRIASGTVRG